MDILFDFDGTIIASEEGVVSSAKKTLDFFNVSYDESKLVEFIGPPLHVSFERYKVDCDKAIEIFRDHYSGGDMYKMHMYETMYETLEKLKDMGHTLHIASSKGEKYGKILLKHLKIDQFFDGLFFASLDGKLVHKDDILKDAVSKYRFNNPVMIGDRKSDIDAAKKVGMKSIAVLFGYGSKEELKEADADYYVASPLEIVDIVESLTTE